MTSLVDTIEAAFRRTVETSGEVVPCTPVVEAIERYCKLSDDYHGSLEGIVDDAYLATRRVWANDWRWQTGEVAERICDGLLAWTRGGG